MTQDELDSLLAQHGGIAGKTPTGPTEQSDPEMAGVPGGDGFKVAIPPEKRQQKIVFKDGSTITVQPKDDGSYDVAAPFKKGATTTADDSKPLTRLDGQGNLLQYDPKTGTFTPVTGADSRVSPEEADAKKQQAIQDQREREYNSTHPGPDGHAYYLTHAELATLNDKQAQMGLDDQRLQLERDRLSAANKQADARIALDSKQADLAGSREDRLTKAAELQSQAQQAAQDLAQHKFEWDSKVQQHEMDAEDAKQAYQQEWNAVQAKAADARLALDQAVANNQEDNAQRTDATVRRGQDLDAQGRQDSNAVTQRGQDIAEGDRQMTAATTALQEAAGLGQEGSRAAIASLPFMAPAGTAASLQGQRDNLLSDPQHPHAAANVPAVPFPFDPQTLGTQLAAQALAQFSPTARDVLAKIGAPGSTPPMVAPSQPAAAPPAAPSTPPAAAPSPTTTIAPDGTVTIQHAPTFSPPSSLAPEFDPATGGANGGVDVGTGGANLPPPQLPPETNPYDPSTVDTSALD